MPKASKEERIKELLTRNVEDIVERAHLAAALNSGKKLRVKLGIDPTGAKIHLGRAVVLWKLRAFQDLGHKVVLIIGDYTALIGDPSDKLEKRPMLTEKDIKNNLKNYLAQIGKIIDVKKAEVRYNSEWLKKLSFKDILDLTDLFTASQMIERRNFRERWDKEEEISLREFMYPLMQGYDSVAVKADVELGGTDQLFNLMAGRKLQAHFGQKPQDIMMTSMILGLDGRKMSTSWGNVVNIADAPEEQFGKLMSMKDEMIIPLFRALTDVSEDEVRGNEAELRRGTNPKIVKEKLALAVVARYHGEQAAGKAAQDWEAQFSRKELPQNIPVVIFSAEETETNLSNLVAGTATVSNSEARRLIGQGAVEYNQERKLDPREIIEVKDGDVLKSGRKLFRFKIK